MTVGANLCEAVLLLDELVGFLVTCHMVHGIFDLLFLALYKSSCFIGPHVPSWRLFGTHVEAYCWIEGGASLLFMEMIESSTC
jgi:hypothetical protein